MKKQNITVIILCLCFLKNFSQKDSLRKSHKKEIDVNYNWSHIGRSLNLNYNHYFGRHALSIGVRQHYNSVITDNQGYAYKNRGYATNFNESIGINIGYKCDLLKKSEIVIPYLFFQSQLSNIRFKTEYETYEMNVNTNSMMEKRITEISNPFFVTENYIGFGLKARLIKNLFLNQTIGGGIATFKGDNTKGKLFEKPLNYNIEFSHSIKIGLIYQFK